MAKPRKMRVGDCRQTKNGQTYCKFAGKKGVRFVKNSSQQAKNLSGRTRSGRGSSTKGKHCIRFKRVTVKGTRGKQRRCAKMSK